MKGWAAAVVAIAGATLLVGLAVWHAPVGPAIGPDIAPALGDRQRCNRYDGIPVGWGQDPHAGMIHLRGGSFELGSLRGYAEERPLVKTQVGAFWIDRTEVTNAQFASFVAATAYITTAQRGGGAAVFIQPRDPVGPGDWWYLLADADWRHPDGADSSIAGRASDPVVDVSLADARAYAHWLGRSLPSEAQWEYAAKAGRDNRQADESLRDAAGRVQANIWEGRFPYRNNDGDGVAGRAPVGCFPANPDHLYDMIGNVWEWTRDIYHAGHASRDGTTTATTASGATPYVIKGGSFLCAANYCARARASSRQGQEADLPTSHLGFRTVAVE